MQAKVNTIAKACSGARTIFAAAFAVGTIAAPGFALAASGNGNGARDQAQPTKKADKQVVVAERAVAKQPTSVDARARLGQTYLGAGRFASASAAFEDAVSLGDTSPATALGMALSYIGTGRNAEAVTLLGQWRDTMPAGDNALALALAGQPVEAITILTAAIKQGENTPKIRQNLAYAYALAGHLPEARVIAAQDVPIDKLDVRVSEWALQASVGSAPSRVAALLGAPVRYDPGQPRALALAPSSSTLASTLAVADAPAASAPAAAELPPLSAEAPMSAQAEPQAAMTFASAEPVTAEPVLAAATGERQFVSNPVVQDISAYASAPRFAAIADKAVAPAPIRPMPARAAVAKRLAKAAPPVGATHVVQLGSFTTEEGAHRAWGIFQRRDPRLKDHELRITKALVNGRNYWRVAAAGYDANSARAKCSTGAGAGECFAYAAKRSLPGAVSSVAARLASR